MRSRPRTIQINGQPARLAELWRRAWARAIDLIMITFAFLIATIILWWFNTDRLLQPGTGPWADSGTGPNLSTWISIVFTTVTYVAVLTYETVLTAKFGKTIGKAMYGIRVVSLDNGLKPDSRQALIRWIIPTGTGVAGAAVSIMMLALAINLGLVERYVGDDESLGNLTYGLLGAFVSWSIVHLSSLWAQDGRGWPDKAAGTIVVKE